MAAAVPPSGRETLEGVIEKIGPSDGTEPDRLTVPVKLFRLVNVMVDVSDEPGFRDNAVGLAETSKSGPATTVTVVVCIRGPLVPVTFTMWVPGCANVGEIDTSSVEFALPPEVKVTDAGVRVAIIPAGGVFEDKATSPENESRLLSVMVEFLAEPSCMTSLVGFALMSKSGGTTKVATVRVAVTESLVPVTSTL